MPHVSTEDRFLAEQERKGALHRMKVDAHDASRQEDVGREQFWRRRKYMALLGHSKIF
jgi:hypothetical protein